MTAFIAKCYTFQTPCLPAHSILLNHSSKGIHIYDDSIGIWIVAFLHLLDIVAKEPLGKQYCGACCSAGLQLPCM